MEQRDKKLRRKTEENVKRQDGKSNLERKERENRQIAMLPVAGSEESKRSRLKTKQQRSGEKKNSTVKQKTLRR